MRVERESRCSGEREERDLERVGACRVRMKEGAQGRRQGGSLKGKCMEGEWNGL